jgi:4-amino-4-deoxy-L-arabinose transferase-like glycosyltransferase
LISKAAPNRLYTRRKFAIILAITALAAFFRLYRLDTLPPGDGHDPALYGIDALNILQGARPIFHPTNFGREALFSYLVTASVLALGPTALAVHLTAAIVGILTIPTVYLLGEELFVEEREPLKSYGGLVAALMMALSYWHLNWSRYGVRAILVPLFAALTLYLLCLGLRTGRRRAFVACGVALGLSLYTYQAARMLPVLVVIAFFFRALQQRRVSRRAAENLIAVVVISLIVFAPLGYYFLDNPGSFSQRIGQVSVVNGTEGATSQVETLWNRGTKVLLMFNFRGDGHPYSTIPFRPALNPVFSLLFFIGILLSVLRFRQPNRILLLAWLLIMLMPAVLAGLGPSAKRAIGTLPAVACLIAIGALAPWSMLAHRFANWPQPGLQILRATYVALIVAVFAYGGFVTYRDYFVTWASNPNLFTHFEVGISSIGEDIGTLPSSEKVFVSPELPWHPGIRYHSGLRDGIRGYNGRVCRVVPGLTTVPTTYVVVPSKDKQGLERLQTYFPDGRIVFDGPSHFGEPYFRAFRVPEGSAANISPSYPASLQWADHIQLPGYDLDSPTYQPGDTINLTLYYQDLMSMDQHYTAFFHLVGPTNPATGGLLWAQFDSEPCLTFFPTIVWETGEIVIDTVKLELPADIPPGIYTLNTGFYHLWTMERLPVTRGVSQDNVGILGQIQVLAVE